MDVVKKFIKAYRLVFDLCAGTFGNVKPCILLRRERFCFEWETYQVCFCFPYFQFMPSWGGLQGWVSVANRRLRNVWKMVEVTRTSVAEMDGINVRKTKIMWDATIGLFPKQTFLIQFLDILWNVFRVATQYEIGTLLIQYPCGIIRGVRALRVLTLTNFWPCTVEVRAGC